MSERAAYSRVYWSIVDDPKFASIYDTDAHLAAWLRLLLIADQAHPASAHLPVTVRKSSVTELARVELIDLLPGGRYRVHGLDAERARRREAATRRPDRVPDAPQPGPNRDPDGPGTPGLSLAEPSQAEDKPSQAEPTGAPDPANDYWTLTGKYPADKTLKWIDDLTEQFGAPAVTKAMVDAQVAGATTATLLGATKDLLRRQARELDRREADEERARLKEKRAKPRVMEPWQEEFRRKLEEDSAA
jgi:hypothetical protein